MTINKIASTQQARLAKQPTHGNGGGNRNWSRSKSCRHRSRIRRKSKTEAKQSTPSIGDGHSQQPAKGASTAANARHKRQTQAASTEVEAWAKPEAKLAAAIGSAEYIPYLAEN